MILDFGEHNGTDMKDVPLKYMISLTGYEMQMEKRIYSYTAETAWLVTHKKEFHEFALEYMKKKCWHCGRKLVPIGNARKKGANHKDWADRYLHKKCWKKLKPKREKDIWFNSNWESGSGYHRKLDAWECVYYDQLHRSDYLYPSINQF